MIYKIVENLSYLITMECVFRLEKITINIKIEFTDITRWPIKLSHFEYIELSSRRFHNFKEIPETSELLLHWLLFAFWFTLYVLLDWCENCLACGQSECNMWHVAWITYVAPSHGVQATSYNEHRERNNNNIKANSIARLQLLFLVFSSLLTFFSSSWALT